MVRTPTGPEEGETSARPKVFISYAREDSRFVKRLAKDLAGAGFDAWFDRERIVGGQTPAEEIAKAVAQADFFLLIVSSHSNQSPWVASELRQAVTRERNTGKPTTIPLRRDDAPVPDVVGEKHYVEFPHRRYSAGLDDLWRSLRVSPPPFRSIRRRTVRRRAFLASALLLTGALGFTSYLCRQRGRPTIAVLTFENASQRAGDDWISTALGDMLTAAMQAGSEARLVNREMVHEAEKDFFLSSQEPSPADFRSRLDVDYVVSGSYELPALQPDPQEPMLTIHADVAGGGLGEPVRVPQSGLVSDLADAVSAVANELRTRLDLASKEEDFRPEFPHGALPQYFSGVERLRDLDAPTALTLLEVARQVEPNHPLVYRRLATAARELGDHDRAVQLAATAARLSGRLPAQAQLEIGLMAPQMREEWETMIEAYERSRLLPEEPANRLGLAEAQAASGKQSAALATLDELLAARPAPPRHMEARAYFLKADFLYDLGRPWEALKAADHGVDTATAAGAVFLAAEVRLLRAQLRSHLRMYGAAGSDLAAARRIFARARDELYVMACDEALASVRYMQGSQPLPALLQDLQRLEDGYRRAGDDEALMRVLTLQHSILLQRGQLAAAAGKMSEAEAIAGQGNRDAFIMGLVDQAYNFLLRGDAKTAWRLGWRAVNRYGDRSPSRAATGRTTVAEIAYHRGSLKEAANLQDQALRGHAGSLAAYDQFRLGLIDAARGDPEGREEIEAARASFVRTSETAYAAEAALELARLDNLEGDFRSAAKLAQRAEEELARAGRADLLAQAQASRAWALACEGDAARAAQLIAAAQRRARTSHDVRVRFEVAIAAARVRAASSRQAAGASAALDRTIKEAGGKGFLLHELEARLAQGEINLALGAGGRQQLRSLLDDRRAKELGRTRRLAARMLEKGPSCTALRPRVGEPAAR